MEIPPVKPLEPPQEEKAAEDDLFSWSAAQIAADKKPENDKPADDKPVQGSLF